MESLEARGSQALPFHRFNGSGNNDRRVPQAGKRPGPPSPGRGAHTPAGARLVLSTRALADAVAGEWRGQGEDMDFATMPFTRLAGTAIDRVRPRREAIITGLLAYAGSDLLCYRAAQPPELVQASACMISGIDFSDLAIISRRTSPCP